MTSNRPPSLRYAWYVVFVLMLCYALSLIDRQILSLLVAPMKRDLHINDTRIGLLQGLSFALFYTVAGLPLGKLADSYSRRRLITAGVVAWSVMTTACSAARNFWSLFFTRMGVGVGEAALSPAAFSLITDSFPPARLGLALSVYSMGIYLGSGLAMIVGGSVVQGLSRWPELTLPVLGIIASWRATFLVVGIPGLLVALLTLTIREPQRRSLLRTADGRAVQPGLQEVWQQLRSRIGSVAGVSLGMVFQAVCGYSFLAWGPAFLQRTYAWPIGRAGHTLGVLTLIFGCLGMYAGGSLCDYWQRRGILEAPLRVGVFSAAGTTIFFPLALLIGNATWTTLLLAAAIFLLALPIGSSYAALQLIFPNQLRGQVSALFLFILSLGGLSLGPLLPGLLNDYVFRSEKMIGPSLAVTIAVASVFMWALFLATYRPYREHYRVAEMSRAQSTA
ncbi:MAG TPA: MFS transporter [Candidatus Sulfotelmatobacter sp.]|nr:MFS transporter [Candidatus Sulfotelmatobacter sp.]